MDSGWIRWMFEQAFPFPFELVYAPDLDKGNLHSKYDVIILPNGAFPTFPTTAGQFGSGSGRSLSPDNVPEEYRNQVGNITIDKTAPQLKKFVEEGGTVLTIGSSGSFGRYLGLPVSDALADIQADGTEKHYSSDKFYIPGSVLRVKIDNTVPVAYGMNEDLDIMFRNNPVYRLHPNAETHGVNAVAWFNSTETLRSGWAWGQQYLNGGTAIFEASFGKGKVFVFGPEITFRAQPHGTFKLLFNGIYIAGASSVSL